MRSPLMFGFRTPSISLHQGIIWVGLLITCQGLLSCRASKTAQCKTLILVTQKIAEKSSAYRNATEEADLLTMADSFEKTADNVGNLNLVDRQLADYQQKLVTIYRGNGEATRSMITALASKDILTAKLAQDQVQSIGKQEQQVVTNINRYCQGP